ncbi:iron-containing redox enzyme family protein [Pseudomonas sp. TMW22090]|uniref:iron-containing redox enzyme family protein n=1 Tax=Pseudomonas sp. TMW22090 TaxID=2506434 RepID=UPI001F0E088A|nr:iron-containing redox enzyme family protein [Pseudomonas sp. TMW22090]
MKVAITSPVEPYNPKLTPYLEKHMEEESNHYEWALEDLRCATDKSESYLTNTLCAEVLAVPGIAYYQIRNITPFAVIGYMLALESHPPTVQAISYLQAKTSLDESAFRTLAIHAEADVGHAAEIYELIDSIKPDDREYCAIRSSLLMTNIAYGAACRAILG